MEEASLYILSILVGSWVFKASRTAFFSLKAIFYGTKEEVVLSHLTQKKTQSKSSPDFATQKEASGWTTTYVHCMGPIGKLKRSDSFGNGQRKKATLTFVRYSA